MTFPSLRKRVSPNPLTTTDVSQVNVGGPFSYHLGDIFTPGAHAWVQTLESTGMGIPLISEYGRGGVASVCCRKFTFDSRAVQLGNVPTFILVNPTNGGLPVGTFQLTSLIDQQTAML